MTDELNQETEVQDPQATPEQEEAQRQAELDRQEQEATEQKPWFQKRFNEITRQKYDAQKLADQERERRIKAEEELERLRVGNQPKQPQQPAQTQMPTREQFDFDDEKYFLALANWQFEQRMAEQKRMQEVERQNQQRQKQQQTKAEKAQNLVRNGQGKYVDWLDVVNSVSIPQTIQDITLDMNMGADVAYYLAKNPNELEKIGNLSPYAIAAELGKIEVKINSTQKKTSTAPDPIQPVKGKSSTSPVPDPDKDPIGWIAARNRGEV